MTDLSVLHIYKDYAPVVGGIENHIGVLTKGLRSCGIDARVLVTNRNSETIVERIGGVPVLKTGRQLNISSAPVSLDMFPAIWHNEKEFDIAHLHLPYPPGELGHLLFGRSKRTVLTYHSDIVRQRVLGTLYSPFLRLTLRKADLIAVSNPAYIRTSPFLRGVMSKCRVIPYGIDLGEFDASTQMKQTADAIRARYGTPLLLFVGKLRHYKGVDVLLHAMQQLNAHLLIIGDGAMEAEWRSLSSKLGLANNVTFAGELPDDERDAAYRAADIFVLPSTNRAEAFGIVQIEAMAAGLPIVSTELGTGTSFVNVDRETGLVVQPGQPQELAEALRQLINDDGLRARMGRNARRRAQEEFASKTMITRIIRFYQEALSLER